MKKYKTICAEIERAKNSITTAAAEALNEYIAANRDKVAGREAVRDYIEKRDTFQKKADEEKDRNERARVAVAVLTANAKRAFFAENIGKICEIWNGYTGKAYGEKTRAKILDALKTAVGAAVCIKADYRDASVDILRLYNGEPLPFDKVEAVVPCSPFDINGKIAPLDPDAARVCFVGEYVDDVPRHVEKFFRCRAKLRTACESLEAIGKEYNVLNREGMRSINYFSIFPSWIF